VDGVRYPELTAALADCNDIDAALNELVHTARQQYTADLAELLILWEPALAALASACAHDDPDAAAVLSAYLTPRRKKPASGHLVERLERVSPANGTPTR